MGLRGISCLPLELFEKTTWVSDVRSLIGHQVTIIENISEAVGMHCERGGEKLRWQRLVTSHLTVFISRHDSGRIP